MMHHLHLNPVNLVGARFGFSELEFFPNKWNEWSSSLLDSISLRFSAELCTAHTARESVKLFFPVDTEDPWKTHGRVRLGTSDA